MDIANLDPRLQAAAQAAQDGLDQLALAADAIAKAPPAPVPVPPPPSPFVLSVDGDGHVLVQVNGAPWAAPQSIDYMPPWGATDMIQAIVDHAAQATLSALNPDGSGNIAVARPSVGDEGPGMQALGMLYMGRGVLNSLIQGGGQNHNEPSPRQAITELVDQGDVGKILEIVSTLLCRVSVEDGTPVRLGQDGQFISNLEYLAARMLPIVQAKADRPATLTDADVLEFAARLSQIAVDAQPALLAMIAVFKREDEESGGQLSK